MKIVFCSSEVYPFAKTGGLADVSGALPLSLAALGHQVKVFMPWYKSIEPAKHYDDFGTITCGGVEFVFIKNNYFFNRNSLYSTSEGDYPDNLERFSFFCRQVLKVITDMNFAPDIIHNNDWQTALIPVYLKILYKNRELFENTKTILTIHNLIFQGIFEKKHFEALGIAWDYFNMHYLEFYGKINLLKGGIIFSDAVTTVSPAYAREIRTQKGGCGLEGVLENKKESLKGILNGIDYSVWDPAKDNFIYKKYSNLEGKRENKKALQQEMNLKQSRSVLLFGIVSRLTEQKGIDILSEVIDFILKDSQLIILGQGQLFYHKLLAAKARKNKKSFALCLEFNEALAHKIYAASDVFLLPSRLEPCGLSQMISFKYGTIPLVHHTGGLIDTVCDLSKKGGGFVFNQYNKKSFLKALTRAKELFDAKDRWAAVVENNLAKNFSWRQPALEYQSFYQKLSKSSQN